MDDVWEEEPMDFGGGESSDLPTAFGSNKRYDASGGRDYNKPRDRFDNRNGSDKPRGCFKCGEEGHMSRDCTAEGANGGRGGGGSRGCFKCGEEGHMSRDCTAEGTNGGRGGGGSRACFKCGEEGHMSRECPSAESGDGNSRPRGCFNCGEEGHMSRDCTNPKKEADGEENLGPDGKPRPPHYVPEHISEDSLFGEGVGVGQHFDAYETIPVSVSGEGDIPTALASFEDSGLRDILLENVRKSNYTRPTPIQRHCIPTILAGRDIMACAQTGSGKTAAFMLPILNKLLEDGDCSGGMLTCAEPSALVVAPTRELAIQIHNEGRKFAHNSVLKTVVVYGGAASSSQYRQLQMGCSVLVATPGRLSDFLTRGYVSLASLKFLVLDEADRMLDMGFSADIEKLVSNPTMPPQRQTLLFSATFPEEIQMLARKYLNNYVFYVVGMVGAANTDVLQDLLPVPKNNKRETLINKLRDITSESESSKVLIFVETKRTADFLASYLSTQQINSTSIHGDRFQSQREEALAQFKSGQRNVLVATAVAARGLDIRGVSHVINYDLPKEVDEYVHRIGRTGRVGNRGTAISFYDEGTDGPLAKNLVKILTDAGQEAPDWLKEAASNSGHSLTYEGAGQFASTDVRGGQVSSMAFGGPGGGPDEEEEWD